jgi:hypothetical protein
MNRGCDTGRSGSAAVTTWAGPCVKTSGFRTPCGQLQRLHQVACACVWRPEHSMQSQYGMGSHHPYPQGWCVLATQGTCGTYSTPQQQSGCGCCEGVWIRGEDMAPPERHLESGLNRCVCGDEPARLTRACACCCVFVARCCVATSWIQLLLCRPLWLAIRILCIVLRDAASVMRRHSLQQCAGREGPGAFYCHTTSCPHLCCASSEWVRTRKCSCVLSSA